MVVYPVIVGVMGFNAHQAGIFLGGTIHDVAQVVGTGYSMGKDAGDTAHNRQAAARGDAASGDSLVIADVSRER